MFDPTDPTKSELEELSVLSVGLAIVPLARMEPGVFGTSAMLETQKPGTTDNALMESL